MPTEDKLNIRDIRGQLAGQEGKRLWRSLEELADTPAFQEALAREFPEQATEWNNKTSRRRFLQLMGASIALAGAVGCAPQPEEKIVPYVKQPEDLIPGKPLFFATSTTLSGYATGLLVESHMGRPTKVEGNPEHPASLGATDVFAQASMLTMYDPERSQTVMNGNQISTWDLFLNDARRELKAQEAKQGAGLRILTRTVTSPTLVAQMAEVMRRFPEASWHQYDPVNRDNARAGAITAFGEDVNAVYDFSQADVILALDADFLTTGPGHLVAARQVMQRRSVTDGDAPASEMSRIYVAESTPTPSGAKADHRLALKPSEIETLARAIASRLGVIEDAAAESRLKLPDSWLDALVEDLQGYRLKQSPGVPLVVVGQSQPPAVHALAFAINDKLGAVGRAVKYTDPVEALPGDNEDSLRTLAADMMAGKVDILLMLDGNPVYDAPGDIDFATALTKTKYRIQLGLYHNDTSLYCDWHIPQAHYLESWSDALAFDGTPSLVQPLIKPLYGGKTAHELLAVLADDPAAKPYDLVKGYWINRATATPLGTEKWWQQVLHDGVIPGITAADRSVSLQEGFAEKLAAPVRADTPGFEVVLRPDSTIYDGQFANNGWLQELPKPITKLTWDNAAFLSPAAMKALGAEDGDVLEIAVGDDQVTAPAWSMPGQPNNTVTLHLGFGQKEIGRVGSGAGFDAYPLSAGQAVTFRTGASLRKTGEKYQLVDTQHHHLMEGRHLVRSGTLAEYQEHPEHPHFMTEGHHGPHEPISFYPDYEYNDYKWGMSINLGSCVGCNACVVACQAENNIPVVGKDQVAVGREMQWLRIDHYYEGDMEDPAMHFQPVNCMHCEKAPCEVVCPVAATSHSPEGLNEMTYNRCVGTRYCANNCPYKVRRFNFFAYADPAHENDSLKLLQNPDVTVRNRGVMEKCTYCVQRINQARITAEKEDRKIEDGEVVTACQAVCPTQAIVFGDMNDPNSQVKAKKEQPLDYGLLEELNTRPRTTFSASMFNPNPKLASTEHHEPAH